ncbi:1-acyl-sn-glycerol-3-phosphate acyltransferase [Sphingobacterium suaedae]|uniref:1-acyl-sn-glycerol-3-phosphate acyltransferase n=1 Tax=Sphingobacterium suaedae TaxID=1686402 RepID=A0ABW5KN41_9SPHI
MEALFYHIYTMVQRNKFIACALALLFLCGCSFLASRLKFEEDITQIIPKSERTDDISRVLKQINFADKITILLEKADTAETETLTRVAADLVDSLQRDSLYIKQVTGRIGAEEMSAAFDFVYQRLPFFLEKEDYGVIQRRLYPDSIAAQVTQNYKTLISPTGFLMGSFIQADPLGITGLGLQKIQQRAVGDDFVLYNGFIVTKDTSRLLLFIDPKYQGADTEHNTGLVDHLEHVCHVMNSREQAGVHISYYGAAPVAVANAKQIKKDISTTVAVSMSILMLLLVVFYRKIYIPVLVFIPTLFATLLAVACLYLYKPVISAISLSVGAVLLGITIDYTLHVLTHFKRSANVRELYQELTRPLLMSGATNAVAFLCLLFVHSEALIDLGIFASICIFSSAVFTLLIIPHLYKPKGEITHRSIIDKLALYPFEKSKVLLSICLVLMVISCFTGRNVTYNNNIADLNYVPDQLKNVENKLDTLLNMSSKSIYLVATGNSFEEAAQSVDKLIPVLRQAKDEQEILAFSGANLLPLSAARQQEKMMDWQGFWSADRRHYVQEQFVEQGKRYGFAPETHDGFYQLLHAQQLPLSYEELQWQRVTGLTDFFAEHDGFFTISTLVKLDESYREAFLERIAQYPEILVLDRQNLNESFLGQLRDDFNTLIGYSFFAVLLILWLFFRRLELVLLSAIPIGLTGLVTAGIMGLFGLEFNIFSAIVCTLIFGHGVDFSIFMTAALQKQYSSGKDELQTYRTSILLAVLTTVLAIGALIFARHPALLSIAAVSLIGVFSAVIITFVFYPILFRFFISDRAKEGKSPYTVFLLVLSLLFFIYYGLGTILLSFVGRFVIALFPWPAERKDHIFRKVMAVFMKSVLYFHPLTKNKTLNPYNETWKKPAIVIANHSSFLDTLSLGMLVPKGIFLVNDWVWNSPIFGRAVKALGFYPVSKGLDEGMTFLHEKIKQGYSLIVFPEGTRSYNNVIKRFHKGAFYLAEQFKLDIIPVYLLGNGDVLPKGDILIFGGQLTPVIGQRIPATDSFVGESYSIRTKRMAAHFRQEYRRWRYEVEGPYYFRKKIVLAYLYKDEEIVRYVERTITQYATPYRALERELPETADITHLSDSYGELDYLLSLWNGTRRVGGVLLDNEKRTVAESIYWHHQRKVHFSPFGMFVTKTLVIHPEVDTARIGYGLLEGVQEIYTFKKEATLAENGWQERQVSEFIIRYSK